MTYVVHRRKTCFLNPADKAYILKLGFEIKTEVISIPPTEYTTIEQKELINIEWQPTVAHVGALLPFWSSQVYAQIEKTHSGILYQKAYKIDSATYKKELICMPLRKAYPNQTLTR